MRTATCFQHFTLVLIVLGNSLCNAQSEPTGQYSRPRVVEANVPDRAVSVLAGKGKKVVTFCGYSGLGYERPQELKKIAADFLSKQNSEKTIVNIGGTKVGIGAVYEVAKKLGFETAGIVSSKAREYPDDIPPLADTVIYIADDTWGGRKPDGNLSPTSEAIVTVSEIVVGIGGGAVARDEMLEAKRRGKTVFFYAAEMNQAKAKAKAEKQGALKRADFNGEAYSGIKEKGTIPIIND